MKKNKLSEKRLKRARLFNNIAQWITRKAGSPAVSLGAFLLILLMGDLRTHFWFF